MAFTQVTAGRKSHPGKTQENAGSAAAQTGFVGSEPQLELLSLA